MTQERYVVIQEWMQDLGLTSSELLTFALVFGFCQDGESDFHGSASYVAKWVGVRREAAVRILRQLVDKGLLIKTEYPGQMAHYTTAGCAILEGVRKSHRGCAEIAQVGCAEIAHDNKVVENIEKINIPPVLQRAREDDKKRYGENVLLTDREHAQLVQRFGADDTHRLVEILDGYLSNPKQRNRYTNHYRAILGWPVTRLKEEKLTDQKLENAEHAGQRATSNGPYAPAVGYGERAMENSRRLEELLNNR